MSRWASESRILTILRGYSSAVYRWSERDVPARLAKANFQLDHYPFDAGFDPAFTMEQTRYWILLFSHNRMGVWKGMLRIELDTPAEDAAARHELSKTTP